MMESLKNSAPAFILMVLAPLLTEVLLGATRLSSMFVFPVEVLVWGGGALLIRYVVRKWKLGWLNMLLLALALSVAEEFLIQQTSLAPMVFQLNGIVYARALGVNYVYLLWALIYESVFVVFLPVYLTELIFPDRREDLWIRKRGIITAIILFLAGAFMAWFSWTQIARPTVFHVQAYNPPFAMVFLAVALIGCLVFTALGSYRSKLTVMSKPLKLPQPLIVAIVGALWAVLLYGIVLLAFSVLPSFSPLIAIFIGLFLAAGALYLVPRWTANPQWQSNYTFSLIFGVMLGSMIAGFAGFIGALAMDLYFKIIVDILAAIFMFRFGFRIRKRLVTNFPSGNK
jgi:hypothetical protein